MDRSFQVGEWTVEPSIGRVSRGETARRLEPKVMELLLFFARQPGAVFSKRVLTDAVWESEYITENRLIHAIADLRRALDDDADDPRYIETIPTRGYRLVARVEWAGPSPSDGPRHHIFLLETPFGEFRLRDGENIIGRAGDVDIRLAVDWVSRHHARITVGGDRAVLEDLGSKNGTFVSGERVDGTRELFDGDEIRVGRQDVVLRFHGELSATLTEPLAD
jgi:DNA-binding winged helix-turn-helix (wHTH) protein